MTHEYLVKGITCSGCVENVRKALSAVPGVTHVAVKREAPQATVTMERHINTAVLRQAVKQYGNYELSEAQ